MHNMCIGSNKEYSDIIHNKFQIIVCICFFDLYCSTGVLRLVCVCVCVYVCVCVCVCVYVRVCVCVCVRV